MPLHANRQTYRDRRIREIETQIARREGRSATPANLFRLNRLREELDNLTGGMPAHSVTATSDFMPESFGEMVDNATRSIIYGNNAYGTTVHPTGSLGDISGYSVYESGNDVTIPSTPNGITFNRAYFDESSPYALAPDTQEVIDRVVRGMDTEPMSVARRAAQERLRREEQLFSQGSAAETESMDATFQRIMNERLYREVAESSLRRRVGNRFYGNPDAPQEGSPIIYNLVRVVYRHKTPIQRGKDFSYKITITTK